MLCVPFKDPKWSHMHDISRHPRLAARRDRALLRRLQGPRARRRHGGRRLARPQPTPTRSSPRAARAFGAGRASELIGRAGREHPLGDLAGGRERIEPARVHVVEQPAQLGVAAPRRGLSRRRAWATATATTSCSMLRRRRCSSPPSSRQERAVLDAPHPTARSIALAADRLGLDDRRLPRPVAVEREDRADLGAHGARGRVVGLVDHDHVGDLHHPGLERLHRVARAGHQHQHARCRRSTPPRPRSGRRRPSPAAARPCPDASSTSSACSVASETPPRWPRVDIERMNTPASRKWSAEPDPVAQHAPRARTGWTGRPRPRPRSAARCAGASPAMAIRLDLPTPGGPVNPATDRAAGVRVELARRARRPARRGSRPA